MFEIDASYTDPSILDTYTELIKDYPELTYQVISDGLSKIEDSVLAAFQVQPGPVKYPIEWTSERQRRAFFATGGFGKGIPYVRTGKLAKAWFLHILHSGTGIMSIQIGNDADALPFVESMFAQQRFHANTGWLIAEDVGAEQFRRIEDVVETGLLTVLYIRDEDNAQIIQAG